MCSIFAKLLNKQIIVGRNFDWIQQGGNVHFIPSARLYGGRTYGLCLFEQFGADRPFDGLNSEGLFVGMTGIHIDDFSSLPATSNGILFDEFGIIRFILERASTTREAVAIFNGCRTVPHGVEPYVRIQYLIVDRFGESCIISGKYTSAIEKLDTDSFMALTNVSPMPGSVVSCDRLTEIQATILDINSTKEAIGLLQRVSLESTVYSCLYTLHQNRVSVFVEKDFTSPIMFDISEEITKGPGFYNFGEIKMMLPGNQDMFKEADNEVRQGFAIEE